MEFFSKARSIKKQTKKKTNKAKPKKKTKGFSLFESWHTHILSPPFPSMLSISGWCWCCGCSTATGTGAQSAEDAGWSPSLALDVMTTGEKQLATAESHIFINPTGKKPPSPARPQAVFKHWQGESLETAFIILIVLNRIFCPPAVAQRRCKEQFTALLGYFINEPISLLQMLFYILKFWMETRSIIVIES